MPQASEWTIVRAMPGNGHQHVLYDANGTPRIRLAPDHRATDNIALTKRVLAGLNSSVDHGASHGGWCMSGPEEGDQIDQSVHVVDDDWDERIEILPSGNIENDKDLGRRIAAILNAGWTAVAA